MHASTKTPDYVLGLIWLLHTLIVLLLARINPNHYTTIDSQYYLESATNILSGNGCSMRYDHFPTWNSTFPMGYPVAISIVSLLTGTNVLVASKLVNTMACGLWLILLNRWFGTSKAVFVSGILFLGPFLKLWAHTWSEPLFLTILFCWTYQLYIIITRLKTSKKRLLAVFLLGLLLISVRYAGIFIIPLALLICINLLQKKDYSKAVLSLWLAIGWTTYFFVYLFLNKYRSGTWYGGQRLNGNFFITENAASFLKGLLNELLLWDINPDVAGNTVIILSVLQIAAGLFFFYHVVKKLRPLAAHFWLVAVCYLLFLFAARIFSPFDEPGYRLLAPCSFLILIGCCISVESDYLSKKVKYLLFAIILFSWLDLMPRRNTEIKLLQIFSAFDRFHPNQMSRYLSGTTIELPTYRTNDKD